MYGTCGSAGPPKTEPDIVRVGVEVPLGDTDLDPISVDVEAKSEDTEGLEARNGKEDTEDAIDSLPPDARFLGNLREEAPLEAEGRSMWGTLSEDGMKIEGSPGFHCGSLASVNDGDLRYTMRQDL